MKTHLSTLFLLYLLSFSALADDTETVKSPLKFEILPIQTLKSEKKSSLYLVINVKNVSKESVFGVLRVIPPQDWDLEKCEQTLDLAADKGESIRVGIKQTPAKVSKKGKHAFSLMFFHNGETYHHAQSVGFQKAPAGKPKSPLPPRKAQ